MEKFIERTKKEYEDFRDSYKNKTGMEVFTDAFKICFYDAFFMLLTECPLNEYFSPEMLEELQKHESVLAFLYDEYLSCDEAIAYNWSDMAQWLESLIEEILKEK